MPDGTQNTSPPSLQGAPLLFEMLRSFTTLARVLNLSRAVAELNSTRQTVRRHISQLEELKGGALFELQDRQYALTQLGEDVLPEARDLLARAEGWATGASSLIDGLQHLSHVSPQGWSLFQQQKPISRLFAAPDKLLKRTLDAWTAANGEIEHEAMKAVRSGLLVFRRDGPRWLCVEIGEDSAYVSWFGWATARSNIGRELGAMPGGEGFAHLVNLAYLEIEAHQGVRLDHTFTQLPRRPGEPPLAMAYERLLLGSRFPDGSFAILSAVNRTYDIEISGVSDNEIRQMPEDMLME